MLDLTGILFSTVMILLIIVRALHLDRAEPWFQSIKKPDEKAKTKELPWRRRG